MRNDRKSPKCVLYVIFERGLRLLKPLQPCAELQQQDAQLPGDVSARAPTMTWLMREQATLLCLASKVLTLCFMRFLIEVHVGAYWIASSFHALFSWTTAHAVALRSSRARTVVAESL